MKQESLPGWAAPIIGLIIGAVLGYSANTGGASPASPDVMPYIVIMCAVIGLVSGLVVWRMSCRQSEDDAASKMTGPKND